jgi:DNA-binding response OmpR family regulator
MVAINPKIDERGVSPRCGNASKAIRLLIADHDEALLACYREFLEAEGFKVRTATKAVDFLTKLRRWLPDVIVLEPNPSRQPSRALARALLRCVDLPPIPVLIHGAQVNALARLEFPICAYEVRPLRPEQMAKRIREVLWQFRSRSVRGGRETSDLPAKANRR